ncbi:winged helix-turn-helix domain-containing protein [Chengkuizengella axinellae]|uniref:Crosslink repair DNA glycosylase YcaQ family protein n=1 Tax=Chengkuizengella axinellae TaxID=3064388 RepID=A0ABT9IXD4_9BACL|nr:crosslink repair DNA glycosylase YcaQ family protein [Chengkuizengella sp. 2205SS18-9]MDP5274028.1 crosslink repair DNA glycosylase YcaQ family protein [Chengkuizengella sp. 2205SS18-9]
MDKMISLTKNEARRFLSSYHGFRASNQQLGKQGIIDYIRRVGCIQFDPLNVVGFNQELVLQSRIHDFKPEMLTNLLYKDRVLIDGWDKNMSIYLTEDWPYFSRFRERKREQLSTVPEVKEIRQDVLKLIKDTGPITSKDLSYDQIIEWPWAPTRLSRAVLESLYFVGDLIIYNKNRTRKIYDLTERNIPSYLLSREDPNQTFDQYVDWYVMRRIGAIGLLWDRSGDAWLGIRGMKSSDRKKSFQRLIEAGNLIKVSIDGISNTFYMRKYDAKFLIQSDDQSYSAILAPLDNMLWDRKQIKELFGFEYIWEVYKPINERRYGYYVLPLLCNDRFVARFEPALDTESKTLIIKNWWWEPDLEITEQLKYDLIKCFHRFLGFLGAAHISVDSRLSKKKYLKWLEL